MRDVARPMRRPDGSHSFWEGLCHWRLGRRRVEAVVIVVGRELYAGGQLEEEGSVYLEVVIRGNNCYTGYSTGYRIDGE